MYIEYIIFIRNIIFIKKNINNLYFIKFVKFRVTVTNKDY